MRSVIILFASILAVVPVLATPAPTCDGSELCGSSFLPIEPSSGPSPTVAKRLSNAERFARGLPPAPPVRRYKGCKYHCLRG